MLTALFGSQRRDEARLAHVLRDVSIFRALPAADLVAIWRRLHPIEAAAGTVLCVRGAAGDCLWIVQAGVVAIRLGLGPGGLGIRLAGPGDVVGEMALLTGAPRSADVVVAEPAVLWRLDGADFEALLAERPTLARELARDLAARVGLMTTLLEEHDQGLDDAAGLRFGPYRVVEQLGVGGMAAVYSAVHVESGQTAAVKVLPVSWGAAPEFRQRLAREAALLQQVAHANVVRLLDVGAVGARLGGGCYLAMEWLPQALNRLLRAQYPEPLPVARALAIAHGVAAGLAAVHAVGLVHRDVKTSNILLRADGTPVLTDFGLATALAGVRASQRLTASNVVVGTADYVSPEQVAGLAVDGRSDIYSLGVVLYELLTGQVPFAGRDPLQTLQAHVDEPPPPLPDAIPPAARAIVDRCLAKRAADRYASADELARALADTAEET
jgi:CRP-like cAMP-binding protein